VTTRELAERIMRIKAIPAVDAQRRELLQKTLLGSLNRAKQTIARVETAGVVSWRLIQAARARRRYPRKSTDGLHRMARPPTPKT